MKPTRILLALLALLLALPVAQAQDATNEQNDHTADIKSKKGHETVTVSQTPPEVPLKILVVISEFAGSTKISSLPYALYTVSRQPFRGGDFPPIEHMRYDVRVPVTEAGYPLKPGVSSQFHYETVGTDIDYGAYDRSGDTYQLAFRVNRTFSSGSEAESEKSPSSPGLMLFPNFQDSFLLVMRNGQTAEGASAVDPVTGHTLKVDVTLTVLK